MRKLVQRIGMLLLPASLCFGNLQLLTQTDLQGQGLGAVATMITFNSGNLTQYEGCVGRTTGSSSDVTGLNLSGGICQASANVPGMQQQTHTVLVSDPNLMFSTVDDLVNNFAVVYNSDQTGDTRRITLQNLVVSVYKADGSLLFSSVGLDGAPLTLDPIANGIGGAHYAFRLDSSQSTTLRNALNAQGAFTSDVRFGAYVLTGCATDTTPGCYPNNDGPETVSINRIVAVPEPGTLALLTASIVVFAYRRLKVARR